MLTVAEIDGQERYIPVVEHNHSRSPRLSRRRLQELQRLADQLTQITQSENVLLLPGTVNFYFNG